MNEEKHSPLPWTVHTNQKSEISGKAFIRAADPEDGLLGEIIADVMEEKDAHHIVNTANGIVTGDANEMRSGDAELFQKVLEELRTIYNDDNETSDTAELIYQIEYKLREAGYETE